MTTVPEPVVQITRYTVSVLPADDINHKHYALQVELKPDGWIVHTGHEYYVGEGEWDPSQARAHRFGDHQEALKLARLLAPNLTCNGRTAAETYRRAELRRQQ